jgi:hypothetical protein
LIATEGDKPGKSYRHAQPALLNSKDFDWSWNCISRGRPPIKFCHSRGCFGAAWESRQAKTMEEKTYDEKNTFLNHGLGMRFVP